MNIANFLACYLPFAEAGIPEKTYVTENPKARLCAAESALNAYLDKEITDPARYEALYDLAYALYCAATTYYFREGMKAGAQLQKELLEDPEGGEAK